jgi:hypothetical protein
MALETRKARELRELRGSRPRGTVLAFLYDKQGQKGARGVQTPVRLRALPIGTVVVVGTGCSSRLGGPAEETLYAAAELVGVLEGVEECSDSKERDDCPAHDDEGHDEDEKELNEL